MINSYANLLSQGFNVACNLLQLSLHASCAQGFFGKRQFNCISGPKIPNR